MAETRAFAYAAWGMKNWLYHRDSPPREFRVSGRAAIVCWLALVFLAYDDRADAASWFFFSEPHSEKQAKTDTDGDTEIVVPVPAARSSHRPLRKKSRQSLRKISFTMSATGSCCGFAQERSFASPTSSHFPYHRGGGIVPLRC